MDRQGNPAVKPWVTSRRADLQPDGGFTLIEMVIAVAILGLALSFVLPRLTGWVDRLAFSLRQQQFEDALAELGGKARRAGRTFILASTSPAPNSTTANSPEPAAIELPSGWTLTVDPPIAFRYDGICTGGTVRLSFPAGEKTYQLRAPYCRLETL
jgi:prepilin-type N-terminal cleavage/methylation domain-containing protein